MTIAVGDRLPEATLYRMSPAGVEPVALRDLLAGRRVAIFAVPGAFTPTCDAAHLPSFIRTRDGFAAKGVDAILCIAVNDPFVMHAWGEASGANSAGIQMLSDGDGSFTRAIGMAFDAPAAALWGRSKRYAMLAEDGVVRVFLPETGRGCEVSAGESLLAAIG